MTNAFSRCRSIPDEPMEKEISDLTQDDGRGRALFQQKQEEILSNLSQMLDQFDEANAVYVEWNGLVVLLKAYINQFKQTHDFEVFRQNCEKMFHSADYLAIEKTPLSFFETLHYALVYVVRSFFRLFDVLITAATGVARTQAATPGRKSFFEYPETLGLRVVKLTAAFHEAMDALQNALDPLVVESVNKAS